MKKTLITGGAGFIGSNLAKFLLNNNHEVFIIDNLLTSSIKNIKPLLHNENFHFFKKDVSKGGFKRYLGNSSYDFIFHLASPASPRQYYRHPVETLLVNSIGTYYLLQFAVDSLSKTFVYASTSEVYGDPQVHPQNESYWGNVNPNGIRSCYDEAKRYGEAMVTTFAREKKIDTKIARIFNTFGPNMEKDDGRVISNFIVQALKKNDITVYGDGKQTRSFCYIDDLVNGLYLLANSPHKNSVINLGNDSEKTINDIAGLIKKMTVSTSKIVYKPLPEDDPKKRRPDLTLAKNLLCYQPKVPLEIGISKTIEYFKKII